MGTFIRISECRHKFCKVCRMITRYREFFRICASIQRTFENLCLEAQILKSSLYNEVAYPVSDHLHTSQNLLYIPLKPTLYTLSHILSLHNLHGTLNPPYMPLKPTYKLTMMSFNCSCRNKNEPNAIYPFRVPPFQ